MAHAHGHSRPPAAGGESTLALHRRSLTLALVLVAGYAVAEVIGGLLTGSLALLADAGHMLSDAAALGLSLFALRIARRPPTRERTYGFHRTEILAALINGATLIALSILIFVEAWERFQTPSEVRGAALMGVALGGLAVNLSALKILNDGRKESLNLRGAWLHVLTDTLGSVQAIAAGALIWRFGWNWADPLASILIGLLVIFSAWSLVRDSVGVLMEGTPGHIDVGAVQREILEAPGVASLHDLHVWSITSGMESLSAHVVVDESSESDVLGEIRGRLSDRFGIDHVTIQLEPEGFGECGGCPPAAGRKLPGAPRS